MPNRLGTFFFIWLLSAPLIPSIIPARAAQTSGEIRIFGFVDNPLNLTLDDLASFPMASEVARLICVLGIPNVVYNWSGIPLFHLLALAHIKPEAYKIVTRAWDGFESDLLVSEAIKPTTLLAFGANGTNLPEINGIQGTYRLVVPCKWGYKWVGNVKEIEAVNTDYKGTYEGSGWGDAGDIENCTDHPVLNPSVQTSTLVYGNRSFEINIFSNAQTQNFTFDYFKNEISANLNIQQEKSGFADFIIPQSFLKGPYNVTIDGNPTSHVDAEIIQQSYISITFPQGNHTIKIVGTEFFGRIPQIAVDYNNTAYTGEPVTFDASRSVDYVGISSFDWSFGDGTKGTGEVTQHTYAKDGIYSANLNVTNVDGISNFAYLTVTVRTRPLDVFLIIRILFVALFVSLLVMLALLLKNRKSGTEPQKFVMCTINGKRHCSWISLWKALC